VEEGVQRVSASERSGAGICYIRWRGREGEKKDPRWVPLPLLFSRSLGGRLIETSHVHLHGQLQATSYTGRARMAAWMQGCMCSCKSDLITLPAEAKRVGAACCSLWSL